ncbi:DUF2589 domain-containing protein [Haliangium sp.]|uniref:DUF2589 domain-containing protein n=1 Tax=Haliangium sp. TaxID=2663208 RepID=UPI003D0D98F3
MAEEVKDLKSLPLYEIIGAPISAMVQAESQAAWTALEFIEKVGFQPPDADGVHQIKMVEFGYTKPGPDGEPTEFVARIPLLALLPLPGIRIKTARVGFAAKISDVYTESEESQQSGTGSWLESGTGVQFRGSLVSSSATTQTTQQSYDMNISVELEQSGTTPGVLKLLEILEQAIHDSQQGGEEP